MLKYPKTSIPNVGLIFRNKLDRPTKLALITSVKYEPGYCIIKALIIKVSKYSNGKHLEFTCNQAFKIEPSSNTNDLTDLFPYLTFDPNKPHLTTMRKDRDQFDPEQWPTGREAKPTKNNE